MSTTHIIDTKTLARVICAAGFIHSRGRSPRDGLGGSFHPRPWGHDFHGATAGRDYHRADRAWTKEESRLQVEWYDRNVELRHHLLAAHRAVKAGDVDAALGHIVSTGEVASDWERGEWVKRRNVWLRVAHHILTGQVDTDDQRLIDTKLSRALDNLAADKARRAGSETES